MTKPTVIAYRNALQADGKALFDAFFDLADDAGYGKYLRTHAADWRLTIVNLLPLLIDALGCEDGLDAIIPEEQFPDGTAGACGRSTAHLFISHGIAFLHGFGLVKLLRSPFLDTAHAACAGDEEIKDIAVILRVLDKFEMGFAAEWHRLELSQSNRDLRAAKHYILLEKRRYYTVFHRMIEPAFVVDNQSVLCDVNKAAEDFFGVEGGISSVGIAARCLTLISVLPATWRDPFPAEVLFPGLRSR